MSDLYLNNSLNSIMDPIDHSSNISIPINDTILAHSILQNTSSTNLTVTTPKAATSVALTTQELWFQLICSYGIIGFISAILNLLIAIVLVRVERLHNRFFVFMFFLSIARLLYAVNHVMLSIFRSLRTVGIVDTARSSLTCHTLQIFTFVAPTMDLLVHLLLIIDRIVSFMSPLTYRNMSKKQAIKICVAAYLACIFFRFLPSYTDVYYSKIVQCINSSFTITALYAAYSKWLDFSLSIIILVAYFVLFWAVQYRLRRSGGGASDSAIKKSMKILPFLRLQLLMHVALIVSGRSMQVTGDALGPAAAASQRLQAYYGQLCSYDVLANAIIFYWRHKKLWWASVRLLCGSGVAAYFQGKQEAGGGDGVTASNFVKPSRSGAPSNAISAVQVAPLQLADVD